MMIDCSIRFFYLQLFYIYWFPLWSEHLLPVHKLLHVHLCYGGCRLDTVTAACVHHGADGLAQHCKGYEGCVLTRDGLFYYLLLSSTKFTSFWNATAPALSINFVWKFNKKYRNAILIQWCLQNCYDSFISIRDIENLNLGFVLFATPCINYWFCCEPTVIEDNVLYFDIVLHCLVVVTFYVL